MSEGQNSTATLTQKREPTERDVEILHQIVLRAQSEPSANERDSLISAYESIFKEQGLDLSQDEVCLYVLLDILRLDIQGVTLLGKFEHVLRNRGVEVLFDEDDTSSRGSAPIVPMNAPRDQRQSVQTTSLSVSSVVSSQDITDSAFARDHHQPSEDGSDPEVNASYLQQLERDAVLHDKRNLFRSSMDCFREALSWHNTPMMEHRADQIYAAKLVFKTFTHWRAAQQEIAENRARAEEFYSRHLLHQLHDSARIQRIRAMDQERLRGWGLYHLTVASRVRTFRHQMDARLRIKYMRVMVDSVRALSARNTELTDRMLRFQSRFDARRVRSAAGVIRHTSQQISTLNERADKQYNYTIGEKAIQKWYLDAHRIRGQEVVADSHRLGSMRHKFFSQILDETKVRIFRRGVLERRYLRKWKKLAVAKRKARLGELYKTARMKLKEVVGAQCLQRLRNKCQVIRQLQQNADELHTANANKFAHGIVVAWYKKAHDAKHNEERAVKLRNERQIEKGMSMLTEKHRQLSQMQQTADNFFVEIQQQRVVANCLKSMVRKGFEVHRREQDADDFRVRHNRQRDRQMLKRDFDQLRRYLAERRGEGPLVLPPATPAQRRAEQLNRLASTTPLFAPRISFAARLRGDIRPSVIGEEDDLDGA